MSVSATRTTDPVDLAEHRIDSVVDELTIN